MSPAAVPPVPAAAPATDDVTAVAGLAREVDILRRAVGPLLDLPGRVDELGRLTGELTQAVAALTARRPPTSCPSWLLLPADPGLARRVLDELSAWLGLVYLRYPDGVDHLPECWAWHPDVVEELLWLMHAWAAAYQGPHASVALVGDWHDRQRPGVIRRIRAGAGTCSRENHQSRSGWTRRPSAAPVVPGAGSAGPIADWWGTCREHAAPEPESRGAVSDAGTQP